MYKALTRGENRIRRQLVRNTYKFDPLSDFAQTVEQIKKLGTAKPRRSRK
jgi:hypothetical protein